jgi:Fe-S cluster assembly iron-binding protein IscA
MLKVTSEAATVLKAAKDETGAPSNAGLRIRRADHLPAGDNSVAVALAFIDDPEPNDQILEEESLRVFIANDLVDVLDNKTLDVRATEDGAELVLL